VNLREDIVRLLSHDATRAEPWWFDDAACLKLVRLVDAQEGHALFDCAHQLLRVAHFLDADQRSRGAAATLLTLLVAISDRLVEANAERAQALVAAAQDRLDAFKADGHAATDPRRVLTSRERPPGTIPAGPAARFADVKKTET
jgi:hypothetical protein